MWTLRFGLQKYTIPSGFTTPLPWPHWIVLGLYVHFRIWEEVVGCSLCIRFEVIYMLKVELVADLHM